MSLSFPSPQTISKQSFAPVNIQLPSLSQILPRYPELPQKELERAPSLLPLLNRFYTYAVKAVLVDALDEYQKILNRFFDIVRKEYEKTIADISKEYALKLKEVMAKYGVSGAGLEYGAFQEDIQLVLYGELKEREKLYLKTIADANEKVSKLVFEFFDEYLKANEFYLDVFENDFKGSD